MWDDKPTATEWLSCEPPYSFHFDIVAPALKARDADKAPMHRLCTLARKMGAKSLLRECVLSRLDVREEVSLIAQHYGDKGEAEAFSITFFSKKGLSHDNVGASLDDFIGQLVVINFRRAGQREFCHSYVYEAIFIRPKLAPNAGSPPVGLLNNFITTAGQFKVTFANASTDVEAVYYCQQNRLTSTCAHSCLRVVANSFMPLRRPVTTSRINSRAPHPLPYDALSLGEVDRLLTEFGEKPTIVHCKDMEHTHYVSILASTVESGFPALLAFNSKRSNPDQEHIVSICGYTRNSDEWHPEALLAYSGAEGAEFYDSSSWVDHFVIHDDNFGPYFTLNCRVLETSQDIAANWAILLLPKGVLSTPYFIQNLASIELSINLSTFSDIRPIKQHWLRHLVQERPRPVLRTLLVRRDEYITHLTSLVGHNGSSLSKADIKNFDTLPPFFWMTEITLPHLINGNKTKLGEILTRADVPVSNERDVIRRRLILGIRLPGIIGVNQNRSLYANDRKNIYTYAYSSLDSHADLYMVKRAPHEW